MNEERLIIFNDYIKQLYGKGKLYDCIGKHIKHVQHFLENCESITKKGYNGYKKVYACLFVDSSVAISICDFLDYRGVGYGRRKKKTEDIKPLEKVSVISKRNNELMNSFILWLQENSDYSESSENPDYLPP